MIDFYRGALTYPSEDETAPKSRSVQWPLWTRSRSNDQDSFTSLQPQRPVKTQDVDVQVSELLQSTSTQRTARSQIHS